MAQLGRQDSHRIRPYSVRGAKTGAYVHADLPAHGTVRTYALRAPSGVRLSAPNAHLHARSHTRVRLGRIAG